MASAFCPRCAEEVESAGGVCPKCGSDLAPTVTVRAGDERRYAAPPDGGLQYPPGFVFAERFTIVQQAGAGGMGVVYKALDRVLDCEVALKLIRADRAHRPSFAQRFRQEVKLTRQISHPNVCRVHDIGEWDGVPYLSMEWIEGETLRRLLRQTGRLDPARALEIAEKIGLALEAAHGQGIVHRDLKPANVMIDKHGTVKVVDFGVAFAGGPPEDAAARGLVGTPPYMAPEQLRSEVFDHRVDLYALGLILREMVAGPRPPNGAALTTEVRAAAGPAITGLLESLLAERPEERLQTAADAVHRIRKARASALSSGPVARRRRKKRLVIAGLGVILILAVASLVVWLASRPPPTLVHDAQAKMYFDRGVHYLREAAEDAQGYEDGLHLLNRAAAIEPDNALIWASLAEGYWNKFEWTRDPSSREEAERATKRAAALDADLPDVMLVRAEGLAAGGDLQAARTALEEVVRVKPDYSVAWTWLANVREALHDPAGALAAHQKAVSLEPGNFRLVILKGIFHQRQGEWDEALRCFRRAAELKPDSSLAWNNLGALLLHTQRFAEAIPAFERAIAIDDRPAARSNLGTAYYFAGRYEDAVAQYRAAAKLEPEAAVHLGNLGDALLVLGRSSEAREAYREAAALARRSAARDPSGVGAKRQEALYSAKAGDAAGALEAAAATMQAAPDDKDALFVNAVVRRLLGRDQESLDWLERAVKFGVSRAQIDAEPAFAGLKDDPRFVRIAALAR